MAVFQKRALESLHADSDGLMSLNQSRRYPDIRAMARSPARGLGMHAITTVRHEAGAVAVSEMRFIASVSASRPSLHSERSSETGPSCREEEPAPSAPKLATAAATWRGENGTGSSSSLHRIAFCLAEWMVSRTSAGRRPDAPQILPQ